MGLFLQRVACAGLLLVSLNASARTVPIELPAPIEFSGWLDDALVSRVILSALAKRQWLVLSDDGHSITAEIRPRVHMARIRVDYNAREIRFAYLDSEALGYVREGGEDHIHSSFNRWMDNLAIDIKIELQRQKFQRDPMHVVDLGEGTRGEAAGTLPPAGPPQRIAALPRDTVVMQEAEPAPVEPVVSAPPPPAVVRSYEAGQVVAVVPGTPLRPRPSRAETGPELDPSTAIRLRTSVRNADGLWWYVTDGDIPGWVPADALRPGP